MHVVNEKKKKKEKKKHTKKTEVKTTWKKKREKETFHMVIYDRIAASFFACYIFIFSICFVKKLLYDTKHNILYKMH